MNENVKYGAAGAAVVALSIGAMIYISQRNPHPAAAPAPVAAPVPELPPEEPAVKYPIAAAPAAEALPSLNDSDAPAFKALADLIGKQSADQFIIPQDLVRHIVVTIDNLPNTKVAERLRPMKATSGKFAVAGSEDAPTLDATNYARYQPLVKVIQSLDDQQLLTIYTRYYPLFQDAYENLGHPPQYFNDRLIEVIDDLLAAPEAKDPIALTQPNVLYEFADPALESRSAGQKVLIRMGSANAAVVKERLRTLRAKLVEQKPVK
jgi:Protein of unknown function (DUF3014)